MTMITQYAELTAGQNVHLILADKITIFTSQVVAVKKEHVLLSSPHPWSTGTTHPLNPQQFDRMQTKNIRLFDEIDDARLYSAMKYEHQRDHYGDIDYAALDSQFMHHIEAQYRVLDENHVDLNDDPDILLQKLLKRVLLDSTDPKEVELYKQLAEKHHPDLDVNEPL